MHELWVPSLPLWQLVLRALLVYAGVMVLLRLSGKRAVGQLTPFDLVLLILIGNAVQNGLNGGDNSLTAALVLSLCLIALNYAAAWLSARKPAVRRLLEGEPVVLARDGHVYRHVLRRELVSRADFDEAMREAGCSDAARIRLALLETNGRISIELREEPQPSSPSQSRGRR